MLLTAIFSAATGGTVGQWTTGSGAAGGSLTLPGLNLTGLNSGSNNLALTISIASRDEGKIYFLVNQIAVYSPGAQNATLYELGGPLRGVIDTATNSAQIDFGNFNGYVQNTVALGVDRLYFEMRPNVNVLLVRFNSDSVTVNDQQASFSVRSLDVVTPDGAIQTYTFSQPQKLIYDQADLRFYFTGFTDLYDHLETYLDKVTNNEYAAVETHVFYLKPLQIQTSGELPVLAPIVFPATFPVYYTIPYPVPFPTGKAKPPIRSTHRASPGVSPSPSARATKPATGTPTATIKPTGSPAPKKPVTTVSPTGPATPTRHASPTPVATGKPTKAPARKATPAPTRKAAEEPSESPTPTVAGSPAATSSPTPP